MIITVVIDERPVNEGHAKRIIDAINRGMLFAGIACYTVKTEEEKSEEDENQAFIDESA
jgi:hypothetical protein